ncbi:MAG: outer membrane beta-barrel protein, partial [Deltaproteobacteria bacterium]|nr:outer membrane beta-barrel protein [Deltaproteobacteria bacterium]
MVHRGKSALLSLGALVLLALPVPARAEGEIPSLRQHEAAIGSGALSLPTARPDLGFHAGGFVIRPELVLSTEYNTNLFYADEDDPDDPTPAWILRVIPGLQLQTPTHSVIVVNANGAFEYRKYFGEEALVNRLSSLGGVAGLRAVFFPRSVVSVTISEDFRRLMERRNSETTTSWDRNFNKAGLDVDIRPGGGAMGVRVGYSFVSDYFVETLGDWGDLHRHDIHLRYSWRFFPFTALLVEGGVELNDYLDKDQGYYGELTDSTPVRVRAGVNGFITKTLAAMLMVGYGNSLHAKRDVATGEVTNRGENASYNSFLADARVSWRATPSTLLQVGYRHDFRDSLFSNFVTYDRVYANAQQRLFRIWDLNLDVGYEYLQYSALPYAFRTSRPDAIQ